MTKRKKVQERQKSIISERLINEIDNILDSNIFTIDEICEMFYERVCVNRFHNIDEVNECCKEKTLFDYHLVHSKDITLVQEMDLKSFCKQNDIKIETYL